MEEQIGILEQYQRKIAQKDFEKEYEKVLAQNILLKDQLNLSEQKLEKCGYQYVRSLELILFQIADLAKEAQSILEDCAGAPYGSMDMKAAVNMIEELATSKDDYYKKVFKIVAGTNVSCLERYKEQLQKRLCNSMNLTKKEFEELFGKSTEDNEKPLNPNDYINSTSDEDRMRLSLGEELGNEKDELADLFVADILKKVKENKGVIFQSKISKSVEKSDEVEETSEDAKE